MRGTLRTLVSTFLILAVFGSFSSVSASGIELVNRLIQQLGVTQEQAAGGAGAIFNVAKEKLSPGDFSKVANAVSGMDDLLSAAPKSDALGGMMGGMQSFRGVVERRLKGWRAYRVHFRNLA